MAKRDRVGELEDALKQRDRRIEELKGDLDKAEDLVTRMREQVEDGDALIESWIEAFAMVLNDRGEWSWAEGVYQRYDALWERHQSLVRQWNKHVGEFNVIGLRRNVGRPLGASEKQDHELLKMHKRGTSLGGMAEETRLGLRTVRTIIEKGYGRDRTTLKHLERIMPDRREVAEWRARKRVRDGLPRRITETLKTGKELVKEAKGTARGS